MLLAASFSLPPSNTRPLFACPLLQLLRSARGRVTVAAEVLALVSAAAGSNCQSGGG